MTDNLAKLRRREDMKFDGTDADGQPAISLTQQGAMMECDITYIMQQILKGAPMPTGTRQLQYGDVSALPDYKAAMDVVAAANSTFATLPAAIRDRFQNDPQNMLQFVADDKNYDEATKMGLLNPSLVTARAEATHTAAAAVTAAKAAKNPTPPAAPKEVD